MSGPPPNPVTGASAQRAARSELARPQYRHSEPDLEARAVHWVVHQLGRLFSGTGGSDALLLVVVVLVSAVVLLAVRAGAPQRRAPAGGLPDADPLAPITSHDHRRVAAELTEQGRHADALREWLRAAVQTIEERGVLAPRPGRTGASTAREAGPLLPAAADDLAAATVAFDEVWFGRRPATADDVVRARRAADEVARSRIASPAATPTGIAVPR